MNEDRDTRLRRLGIRSRRRGTREMDLVLGRFWGAASKALGASELDMYEDLLRENDQDLYAWICGKAEPPDRFVPLIARIKVHGAAPRQPG
ncbi:MAG: succinate dehydrogenase assembly factor 2 [Boseongicola sp. SB0675_bin_26]|nr:succinate dehydrogenase assembly factor 2 [Boseongicola sp. SB0675_bin_26]